MSKDKTPKPRPDKYAEKVHLNVPFEKAISILAEGANKAVKAKQTPKPKK